MQKNSWVHYAAKCMVDIMLYTGIVCVAALMVLTVVLSCFKRLNGEEIVFLLILTVSGALAVYILHVLKRMFRTLLSGNPFVSENVSCFRRIAVASAAIALVYLVKCVVLFSIETLVIAVIFAIACLFCLTLKDVFKQAVSYKEENDLTI